MIHGWLFLACGWYGALGRVANFEMCHLRSLGRVANFKNDACGNGGIGFDFLSFEHVAHAVVWSLGGVGVGGGGGCINFLDEHFLYVTEDAHMLHMLSYDHQGGWGVGGVLTSLTSTSFTLRKMQTLHMLSVVSKIIPTKGSSWPKSTTNKISLLRLRLIIFEVVCGINPIEPLLLVPNKWMEHGNTWKNGDLRRCPTKKQNVYQKKVHLGLQLDMASQRCLVADCGFCIATSSLAPLASRREKNWKSECRPDMIRMIENHKFLMFFSWPLKSKIDSPRRRNAHFHSWVTRLPIEMNVHVANIFWRLLQIPAFCLLASKIRISNSSPLQGRRVNRLPCFSTSMLVWKATKLEGESPGIMRISWGFVGHNRAGC